MTRFLSFALWLALIPASSVQAAQPSPHAYLDEALTLLETQHVNRDAVDWKALKAEAWKRSEHAATIAETYPAIDYVIAALGERHTVLHRPPTPMGATGTPTEPAPTRPFRMPEPTGEVVAGRYGYIRIPTFGAPADHPDADLFTAMSRRIILGHDRTGVCGWIVDVRGNTGGNIWPMADGLLPLLAPRIGAGPYWSFEVDGKRSPVMLKDGRLTGEGVPERLAYETRTAKRAEAPIAILIDSRTASSGEGVASMFKGLPGVRYFGEPTADYVTVNNPVSLADGAVIQMTVGYSIDRSGRRIAGPVEPDEKTTSEGAKAAAVSWLSRQPC